MVSESIVTVPDPARTMEGLRDTGYEFNTAVADLVDNSIAAHATVVEVQLVADVKGNIRFSIADNGDGMDREGLIEAMKYGSPRRADPSSLGKFGLGLKTASTAYARRLSVVSRNSGTAPLLEATWDLDHVATRHEWELLLTDKPDGESIEQLEAIAPGHSGTVVVWNKVDRLMNYKDSAGGHARRGLEKRKNSLIEHMAMVYQRFLDQKDTRAPNVTIRVNGTPVKPWDPFQIGFSELLAEEPVKVEGSTAEFTVRAYCLPRPEEFPSKEAAANAKIATVRQGIYVYRQERLIHDADWLDMFSIEPHLNLMRVEFSFNHELDDFFHLDIKKSQIILDEQLWTWLKDQFLPAPRREANRRYREGERKEITKNAKGAHDVSNRAIGNKEAEVGGAEVNVTDPNNGTVTVINPRGKFTLKLPVGSATRPGEVFIQPSGSVTDGMLFEPVIIEQHKAVRINTDHPYYRKVYVPNLKNGVTIQGMDSLLWALAVAELSATTDKTEENFRDMRYEVSRVLRKLVDSLPEPELGSSPMPLDATTLAAFVSGETGLTFKGTSGFDQERNRWIMLEPDGHDPDHAFAIRITLRWRRLEIAFEPGKFAAELLVGMSTADGDGRALFAGIIADTAAAGATVSFRVNGAEADPRALPSGPWNRLSLGLSKGNLELGAEDAAGDEGIVREWTARFAAAVMALLPLEEADTGEPDVTGYPEGALLKVEVNRYERDRRNRAAALAIHGRSCKGCGMSFDARYGEIASGFIEVHHVTPVSTLVENYVLDPAKDLIPLCPNCHAVVHRCIPPMAVDELRQLLRR